MALTLLPAKGKGQVMAVGLALVALGLAYFVGLHWFVKGHLAVASAFDELRDSELRFRQEVKKRPELEKRLSEVRAFEANNVYFLPEATFDLAAAGLSTRLKEIVASRAGNAQRCLVLSTQPQHLGGKEPYERVSVQVRLRCDLVDLIKIIYEVENATPLLFVDELNLYQQPIVDASMVMTNGGNMDARFDLSGYLRLGEKAAGTPP